ncbi:MAG: hypothetical protein RR291_00135, partial [Clostridia bacterium]
NKSIQVIRNSAFCQTKAMLRPQNTYCDKIYSNLLVKQLTKALIYDIIYILYYIYTINIEGEYYGAKFK